MDSKFILLSDEQRGNVEKAQRKQDLLFVRWIPAFYNAWSMFGYAILINMKKNT